MMEIIFSLMTIMFVGLIVAAIITFGLALLAWVLVTAAFVTGVMMVKSRWRRWRFVHENRQPPPGVIDVEFKDITKE